jgi:hypothetical protein
MVYTYAPGISQPCPRAAGRAHQWRTVAGTGEQEALEFDWTHHGPIEGGGVARDDTGERRRRDRGSARASARVLVSTGEVRVKTRPWELL